MSLKEDPRGTDLRWRPASVERELARTHSAFRYAKQMASQMDDSHGENLADEIRLLMDTIESQMAQVRELLTELAMGQRRAQKAEEAKETQG